MRLIFAAALLLAILVLLTILIVVGRRVLPSQPATGIQTIKAIASDLKRDTYVAKYSDEAAHLWQEYVPKSGQASTVQGELIRELERLRDEAERNGNLNWDAGYARMTEYLEKTLCGEPAFDTAAKQEIRADLARLKNYDEPVTDDQVYARLTDRVVEWCRAHPKPVSRARDPELKR